MSDETGELILTYKQELKLAAAWLAGLLGEIKFVVTQVEYNMQLSD